MCDKILCEIQKAQEKCSDDYSSQKPAELKGGISQDAEDYEKFVASWPAPMSTWCPRASMYYAYTEDISPFDRMHESSDIGTKISDDDVRLPHFDPPQDPFTIREPYEENAAREKYLRTDPVCFAIFGKPGLSSNELAKLISEWWQCALITPESVIAEEIERKTEKGLWIEDILQNGGTIAPYVIMNLIDGRVKKNDVLHRGYVVAGLPLIPDTPDAESCCPEIMGADEQLEMCCTAKSSCRVKYELNNSLSQSSASLSSTEKPVSLASLSPLKKSKNADDRFNLLRSLKRSLSLDSLSIKKPTDNIGAHRNLFNRGNGLKNLTLGREKGKTPVRVNPFVKEARGKVPPYESNEDYVPEQVKKIFNDWPLKPTVIIYIVCPDDDVIKRHAEHAFNLFAGESGDTRFGGADVSDFDINRLEKHLSNRRSEEEATVKLKCEIYKRLALPVIDRYVLHHNPQNVIRVDGRTMVAQMFQIINTKLRTLPLSRAILPKRIGSKIGWKEDVSFEGEGDEEPLKSEIAEDNFEGKTNEEIFEELSSRSTISMRFRWTLSNWKFTCPVELAQGRTVDGRPENAVRFMNNIFFVSAPEAMEMFLENPRPFVLPMTPKPSLKIAVFGPRYSGKSDLTNALARNFGASVVNVRELEKGLIDSRVEANVAVAMRGALGRVIANLEKRLETERESREHARLEALNFWSSEAKQVLEDLDRIRQSDISESEEPANLRNLQEKLQKLGLEFLAEDSELLGRIEQNESVLHEFAPKNLKFEEPPVRELTEHDPEVAFILENEVKHLRDEKIAIASSEMAGLLISMIKMMPEVRLQGGLLKEPGWIIDGLHPDPEIWRILVDAGVVIDDLILIIDELPYEKLVDKWRRYNSTDEGPEGDENEDDGENRDTSHLKKDVESYINEIQEFEQNWQIFMDSLEKTEKVPFVCNFDKTSNMYETLSKYINGRFRLSAKIMTEEERARESEDATESVIDVDEEEEDEDEEPRESREKPVKGDNRRLGDTSIYCPVVLARHGVLWKGKDEYSALYLDKIYLCSSAEALDDFVKNPEAFHVPFKEPVKKIPPARIFIVGPPGSGKSTLAKLLSEEFDMTHVDFSEKLNEYVRDRGIDLVDIDQKEGLEEIELPSDLTDDKYNVDRDTILTFVRKYKKEGATLPRKMMDECFLNFFTPFKVSAPAVFDSFPNCAEDVEVALANYAAPDLVIELECSVEKTQDRLLPGLLKSFMEKLTDSKKLIKKEEYEEDAEEEDEEEDVEDEASEHDVDPDEAREKILQEIEESYNRTTELRSNARNRMEEESVSWIKINGEKDSNALLSSLRKFIHPLVTRNSSLLERTYNVDPEIAEDLLECGYYFLSTFGRSCPVQMYNKIPIQLYLAMESQDKIYTVLHRQYVYFIAGEESMKMFTNHPLKYLQQDSCDPVIPARISIVGPPKSGKSTAAGRFARAYGMRVITREDALRWTKMNYAWTKTGSLIEETLRSGKEVTNQLAARAIELYLMNPASSTQGFVLDGFPTNREEAEELALLNIQPMIVLNFQADDNFCLASSAVNDRGKNQDADNFLSQISHRYDTWKETSPVYLEWMRKYAQNVVDIDATGSKWAVWRQVDREVRSRFADIKRYFREADYEKVHCLRSLCVSPYEFRIRQSPHHESYCPACLHHEDELKFSTPPDRRGVVQFLEHFYWICPRHFETFLENPRVCLPPKSTALLPVERPQILSHEIDVDHACWARRLRADGNCIVTYADAQPEYQVVPGQRNLGVLYEDNLYLFCSSECREKFCSRPSTYSRIEMERRETSPSVELKNLPTVNFLEQTVADALVKAVTEAAAARPKYPGMSPAVSAAVYIGIHLKLHNANCTLDESGVYEEVKRRMDARCQIIGIATRNIKRMINPHVGITKYTNTLDANENPIIHFPLIYQDRLIEKKVASFFGEIAKILQKVSSCVPTLT